MLMYSNQIQSHLSNHNKPHFIIITIITIIIIIIIIVKLFQITYKKNIYLLKKNIYIPQPFIQFILLVHLT